MDIWRRLEEVPPAADDLSARLVQPEATRELLAAVDAGLRRHLLVVSPSPDESITDEYSRGLSVRTRDLTIRGTGTGRYIDISCHDPNGYDAFDLVAEEIVAGLTATRMARGKLVSQILAKWRRFWSGTPTDILPWERVLGLFGEIWFLSVWLIPKVGAAEAVKRWRGPFGARHDFEWLGGSVEVKTTAMTPGHIHLIHGVEQLEPPDSGRLEFFSLRVREEAGASNTLPTIVDVCRKMVTPDADAADLFEIGLSKARYQPQHEAEYDKRRLRIVEEGLFKVVSGFPRIVRGSFAPRFPDGIGQVDYEISMSGLEDLRIASSPNGLPIEWPSTGKVTHE